VNCLKEIYNDVNIIKQEWSNKWAETYHGRLRGVINRKGNDTKY
jgi:hypothetical protein